jgi:hypothetical protein
MSCILLMIIVFIIGMIFMDYLYFKKFNSEKANLSDYLVFVINQIKTYLKLIFKRN